VAERWSTPLTRRLGLAAPIIQAPMNWATDARLVAAVSRAGGLGVLGPNAGVDTVVADPEQTAARLRAQIRAVREQTDRPFAVNVPIGHGAARVFSDAAIAVVLEERVGIVIVVMGSPEVYTARLKAAGVFVIHAVAAVKHALKAARCGVDAVVAEGFDAGGHSGDDELPMSVLVPQVVDAVDLPVIAAGGIVDGRGLVIGLAAGAQAVYMGTRFMATHECPIHDRVKQSLVAAPDVGTVSWGRSTGTARTLRNAFATEFRRRELAGAGREALLAFIAESTDPGGRRVAGLKRGDLDGGEVYAGAGVGMIRDIVSCAEVIERTLGEADRVLGRLAALSEGRE
jgi:NAD(P)H-dependent flavin oxidoreductase YrpB (nitropropane dioxygenase family)